MEVLLRLATTKAEPDEAYCPVWYMQVKPEQQEYEYSGSALLSA
jgi:hypothetical protein